MTRHLQAVPDPVSAGKPDREIAVRFTSTSGLVAPVRKPLNSFRWVGPGTLRFSDPGVLITAKSSTLLGLRQTQRFIPSAQIRDVYREGNAVQVHLRGPRAPYFRLWAADSASAAQIVSLLPTRQTIEFESELQEIQAVRALRAPVLGVVVLCALVALAVVAWRTGSLPGQRRGTAMPALQATPVSSSARGPATRGAPAMLANEDALLARQDLRKYGERIQVLRTEFAVAFNALMDGKVTQAKFADELQQWLLPQWDDLELQLRRANAEPHSSREAADDHLMAAINNWQLALRTYADDLRNQRPAVSTFDYLRRAEQQQARASDMLDALEKPSASGQNAGGGALAQR